METTKNINRKVGAGNRPQQGGGRQRRRKLQRQKKALARRNRKTFKKGSMPVSVGPQQTQTKLASSDVRVATSTATSISLTSQLKTVTIDKVLQQQSIIAFCIGYLSQAYEKGFFPSSANQNDAFFALTFMANLILSYAGAQNVPVTQMPYWLLCLCHAVSPKNCRFAGGNVNYQFSVPSGAITPAVNTTIGYSGYGFLWSAGGVSGTLINGFPTESHSGFPAYTETAGAQAFQELAQFMLDKAVGDSRKMSELVPSTGSTPFQKDVSAFALYKLAEGTGFTGQGGGIYGQLQHEVPIICPLLALFGSGEDSFIAQSPTRNYNWSVPVAGDPCTLGALMSTLVPPNRLKMKRNLRFKPIDFLEFGETLADWVMLIVQSYFNDPSVSPTLVQAQTSVCPLTLQEVLLLLRAVIVSAFKDTQPAAQGIYPFLPASGTDNEFVPYTQGVTTCALFMPDIILPIPLIENIRALKSRAINFGASKQDLVHYIPVLGQYVLDVLSSSNYTATYTPATGSPTTVPVFASGALWEKEELNHKGEKKKTMLTEAPISLVDGSSSSNLVFINDTNQLKALAAQWNTWLKTSGVESYTVATGTFGTEDGINALCSIGMTRVWDVGTSFSTRRHGRDKRYREVDMKKDPNITVKDVRMNKPQNQVLVSSPYSARNAIVDLSQGEVLSAPYEQVLSTWILPIDDDELIIGENSTIIQRWQFMMGEPYSVPRAAALQGTSLAALHLAYAAKMTKGKLSETGDWTTFFDEMAKLGRGGVLSGLVAGLVGQFIPALGGIANSIAGALPI